MKKFALPLIILAVVVVILIATLGGSYNNLVQLDEEVSGQWSQIQVQLKRRADLIPNLVNTVKGFAEQEKEVLLGVTKARSGLQEATTPEEAAKANDQLTSALGRLNVVVEKYPELKSDQNFIRLQDELAGTENRIAVARKDYNDSVKVFNQRVRRFPTNIVAGILGFGQRQYFEAGVADQETPNVEF